MFASNFVEKYAGNKKCKPQFRIICFVRKRNASSWMKFKKLFWFVIICLIAILTTILPVDLCLIRFYIFKLFVSCNWNSSDSSYVFYESYSHLGVQEVADHLQQFLSSKHKSFDEFCFIIINYKTFVIVFTLNRFESIQAT